MKAFFHVVFFHSLYFYGAGLFVGWVRAEQSSAEELLVRVQELQRSRIVRPTRPGLLLDRCEERRETRLGNETSRNQQHRRRRRRIHRR